MTTRRDFVERLALGTGGLAIGAGISPDILRAAGPPAQAQGEWDMTWRERITGKHRLMFDSPEMEGGGGMFRAIMVGKQYQEVFATPAGQISSVLVIRHLAIPLVMSQAFWERHDIAKTHDVRDLFTNEVVTRNPAVPIPNATGPFADYNLPSYLASGGIVLACNLALQDMVQVVSKAEGLQGAAARARTLEDVMPGVILQPSGVFAAAVALEAGCHYVRAS